MSFLYPKSTTITLAPWFQFVPWVGGHILNGVSKHLCCVLNWIERTFATWSNVLIFFNLWSSLKDHTISEFNVFPTLREDPMKTDEFSFRSFSKKKFF